MPLGSKKRSGYVTWLFYTHFCETGCHEVEPMGRMYYPCGGTGSRVGVPAVLLIKPLCPSVRLSLRITQISDHRKNFD